MSSPDLAFGAAQRFLARDLVSHAVEGAVLAVGRQLRVGGAAYGARMLMLRDQQLGLGFGLREALISSFFSAPFSQKRQHQHP